MATKKKGGANAAPKATKARKFYVKGVKAGGGFDITKQPPSVRKYVQSHLDDKKSGFGLRTYGDVSRDAIAAERKKRAVKAKKNPGIDVSTHTMTAAKKRLARGWKRSQNGQEMKKTHKFYVKQGMSSKAALKRARDNHGVKFGVDPYHK